MGTTLSRDQLMRNAEGVITESLSRYEVANAIAPVSQTVYGVMMGLRNGDSVTGVAMLNSTAAVGTAPTTARFGIADSTGKILAISGNLNAAANFPLGACLFAFAAPYSVTADGGYYACFVVNGTWGTTQPTLCKGNFGPPVIFASVNGGAIPHFTWTGQADLPAVNSSVTFAAASTQAYWLAFYGTPVK
jgi:hypothetical protein